jgi:hypothetical protein
MKPYLVLWIAVVLQAQDTRQVSTIGATAARRGLWWTMRPEAE